MNGKGVASFGSFPLGQLTLPIKSRGQRVRAAQIAVALSLPSAEETSTAWEGSFAVLTASAIHCRRRGSKSNGFFFFENILKFFPLAFGQIFWESAINNFLGGAVHDKIQHALFFYGSPRKTFEVFRCFPRRCGAKSQSAVGSWLVWLAIVGLGWSD